ncbi:MAG: NADP-dependent malic enzyme [Bryobacterales bacterium]|nr:NADP-dependent malic enzyme [Bryobacterales bacterium]
MSIRKEDALEYHSSPAPGKIAVVPTKPCRTQRDLSLAYSPGVAVPCLEIERDPNLVYKYTGKGNLVAVVTNGTAVLGLGNIGAMAGKPVMEGKGVLFKRFADIDVFDIELNTKDPKEIIRTCQILEPTFGGINLEDIRAPECFEIEDELRRTLKIPVFHDDQHGTAIIAGAALLNAAEITGKSLDTIRAVFNGAGASGIACAEHFTKLGIRRENITMCDTAGVVYKGRPDHMNQYKERFAQETKARTLAEALNGADVFFGLSAANCVTPEMLLGMAPNPIVFAMANPDPEIAYDLAVATRSDLIMATGRSDYPNQVNNVLGFPFIFRGALDVRATMINDEMKLAATKAIAALAKEDVPDAVRRAYGVEHMEFGRKYIIPTPFDSRVLIWVASAVAKAAMDTGVAQMPIDIEEYKEQLARRLGKATEVTRILIHKAQRNPVRVVFPEGEEEKILRACDVLMDEGIARPILLGNETRIRNRAEELRLDAAAFRIVDPKKSPLLAKYTAEFYALRQRKGVTQKEADQAILDPVSYGSMMVRQGDADALVAGLTRHYPDTLRPALQVIPHREGCTRVSGMYMMITPRGQVYFLADTTVNIEPSSEDLAEIAIEAADTVRRLDIEPRVAMLSFSNFGSTRHPLADKVKRAVELVHRRAPELIVDGEMQADTAVTPEILSETYPFSVLREGANVLIFPNLEAGNIAYKLLMRIGGADAIGPILMGLSQPVHVLQRGCEVADIVNVTAIAVVDAQRHQRKAKAKRK